MGGRRADRPDGPGATRRRGVEGRLTMGDDETAGAAEAAGDEEPETFNPWSVVNLVFEHLVDQGLHPVLGELGDPSVPARALLETLGIEPRAEGNAEVMRRVRSQLDELRAAVFDDE